MGTLEGTFISTDYDTKDLIDEIKTELDQIVHQIQQGNDFEIDSFILGSRTDNEDRNEHIDAIAEILKKGDNNNTQSLRLIAIRG